MSCGHKPCWLLKLDILGASQVEVLKVEETREVQTLGTSGRSWESGVLQLCVVTPSGVYGEAMSLPLLSLRCGSLSHLPHV